MKRYYQIISVKRTSYHLFSNWPLQFIFFILFSEQEDELSGDHFSSQLSDELPIPLSTEEIICCSNFTIQGKIYEVLNWYMNTSHNTVFLAVTAGIHYC